MGRFLMTGEELDFLNEALLGGGGVPMSPVWISQPAMSQFWNILVPPVGISIIIF